ncbi:hypothetical protein AZE42_01072 [Rhizopogon vesiculosus]|uniref:Uncharacterized protein n=1 Tax=Rhizopogon vesiculosus TaxID=180088 RepID=A0A1J8Q402_9AGAM|nr:hypothetical protein AZE42_01072 [Rhizopogon vesiculosus]
MSHSKLEVEDEEKRQQRIGNLLEHLNSSSSPKNTSSGAVSPTFDFGDRKTYPVDPPSELLARIQDFLPRLKAENDSLTQRIRDNPSSNLGLGVLETRPKHSHSDDDGPESESASEDSSSLSTSSAESDSEDVSNSDSSSGSSMRIEAIATRPIKPLPRRAA